MHALLHLLLLASPLNTPKRFGAGQALHTEGAQGTASRTRRAWEKVILVFSYSFNFRTRSSEFGLLPSV